MIEKFFLFFENEQFNHDVLEEQSNKFEISCA